MRFAVAGQLTLVQRAPGRGDANQVDGADPRIFARLGSPMGLFNERAPLVVDEPQPRRPTNSAVVFDARRARGIRPGQSSPVPLLERARGRRFVGLLACPGPRQPPAGACQAQVWFALPVDVVFTPTDLDEPAFGERSECRTSSLADRRRPLDGG